MDMKDLEQLAKIFHVRPIALFRSPDDYQAALALDRFAVLTEQIGTERAHQLLDGIGAPKAPNSD